jgi:biotin transport system permease protein
VTVGLYVPGRTPIHRMSATWKVVAVFAGGTLVVATDDPRVLGVAGGCVCLLYGVARIRWRVALGQVRPVLPVLLVLCAVQWLTGGVASAVLVGLRLVAVILLAMLVTLTTRVSDMVRVIERALSPLERLGVQTGKVSLAISMTLRFIPLLTRVGHEVREAQRARGLERNVLALAVPMLVRALHTAEQVAEAIDARGP